MAYSWLDRSAPITPVRPRPIAIAAALGAIAGMLAAHDPPVRKTSPDEAPRHDDRLRGTVIEVRNHLDPAQAIAVHEPLDLADLAVKPRAVPGRSPSRG